MLVKDAELKIKLKLFEFRMVLAFQQWMAYHAYLAYHMRAQIALFVTKYSFMRCAWAQWSSVLKVWMGVGEDTIFSLNYANCKKNFSFSKCFIWAFKHIKINGIYFLPFLANSIHAPSFSWCWNIPHWTSPMYASLAQTEQKNCFSILLVWVNSLCRSDCFLARQFFAHNF